MSSYVEECLVGLLPFQANNNGSFCGSKNTMRTIFSDTRFHFGTLLAAYSLVKILWIGEDYE
jgi:hypothetical protein